MVKNQPTLNSRKKYVESLIGDIPVSVGASDNFLKPRKSKKVRRITIEKSDESFSERPNIAHESFSIEEVVRVDKQDKGRLRSKTTIAPEWAKLSLASIPPNRLQAKTKKSY